MLSVSPVMRVFDQSYINLVLTCVKYPVAATVENRNAAITLADMKKAVTFKRAIEVPSPCINVPRFDIACSFRPDYIHCKGC